jgi:homoserine kinase
MQFASGSAHVRAPATSANLGPGFDSFGLALALYDEVTAAVGREGLSIEVEGEGGAIARDETHLVVRAMRAVFDRLGGQPPGLVLISHNRIPHGRGLGSSAAAIVSGMLLARALVVGGAEQLPDSDLLAMATQMEGHPDNVAACLLGGFTIAWTENGRPRAAHAAEVVAQPVLLVPATQSSTAVVRGLLPETVPHADAVFAAGRSGLLAALLTGAVRGSRETWLTATDDRLHQPYRAAAMPETAALVSALRAAGLPAVTSGAGPSVLVLLPGVESGCQVEVEQIRRLAGSDWAVLTMTVDAAGADVRT